MNYIGSKLKLSSFLESSISATVGNLGDKIFCDIFAGTGIVGRIFKNRVKKVIANDLEYYSFVLNRNYIGNHKELKYDSIIEELNSIKPKEGFIYKHYSLGGGSGRQYFSDENAKLIDAMRQRIEDFREDEDLYYFLLASLLESADKVANTASIYGAYLKDLKKSARKSLVLEPAIFELDDNSHKVHNQDSNELIKSIRGDILYLDPPYNARQYGANYHILNTIAKYDEFMPSGKTGLREYNRSMYCKSKKVSISFEELIENADFKYIFLSYNNEGLMSKDEIRTIMSRYGEYDLVTTKYQRFKADKSEKRNHKADSVEEYLHILVKF